MNFDWSQYLVLSGDLLDGHDKVTRQHAARWRTIVSRSYYAALHIAQAYCERVDRRRWRKILFDAGQTGGAISLRSHDLIIQWFDESRNAPENEAAETLRALRGQRVVADYQADKNVDERYAQSAYGQAKELIEGLGAALAS